MKKFLAGLFGLLIMTSANASTESVKAFVGGNFSLTDVLWTSYADNEAKAVGFDLANLNAGLGIMAGARYATKNTYNIGGTFFYDYILNSKASLDDKTLADATGWYKWSTGFSMMGVTLDNYIRLFRQNYNEYKRGDLVIGLGTARVTSRHEIETTAGRVSSDDYSSALVVNLGYNGQMDQNWDWFIHGRWFYILDNTSENEVNSLVNVSVGVKYNF